MDYYNEIKNELLNNEVYKEVKDYSKNKSDLNTYYNVGKLLIEAQGGEERAKYGDKLIKEYSKKLIQDVGKQYNYKTLLKMRKFYMFSQKVATLSRQLTWSHFIELLKFDDLNKINYYISTSENQNLSVRELKNKIKNKEYERLNKETKNKLIVKNNDSNIENFLKHPIIIKNKYNYEVISEKILKQLILEDMDNFLTELGNRYNYIDLLLYNIEFNCYVVIELKVTKLKSEYIGQIQKYMNFIDKNIKSINQDKTIGIIICKKDNQFVMEYCSDKRIYRTTYELIHI